MFKVNNEKDGLTSVDIGLVYLLIILNLFKTSGSSRREVFCKKGALRNFTKFTGTHLCQGLFFK